MLRKALEKAKREGGKKVPINFQVPSDLKDEFDGMCKRQGVSITSMLTALMETAIDEAKGIYAELDAESLLGLNNRIKELKGEIFKFEEFNSGNYMDEYEEMKLHSMKDELSRLELIFEIHDRQIRGY
jgi:hypothetical protein